MDFWELSTILLRRWLIFAPLAALTAVAAVLASGQVQPTYSAQASVVLLPPPGNAGTNAYLSLGIPTTAQSLAVAASDVGIRRSLAEDGLSSDVAIGSDRRSALLTVSAEATTRETAVATVSRLVQLLEQRLVQQQDDVAASPNARITLQSLTPTIVPVPVTEGATRLAVVIVAVGLTVATTAALAVEGLARRRAARGRRQVRDEDVDVDELDRQLLDDRLLDDRLTADRLREDRLREDPLREDPLRENRLREDAPDRDSRATRPADAWS